MQGTGAWGPNQRQGGVQGRRADLKCAGRRKEGGQQGAGEKMLGGQYTGDVVCRGAGMS